MWHKDGLLSVPFVLIVGIVCAPFFQDGHVDGSEARVEVDSRSGEGEPVFRGTVMMHLPVADAGGPIEVERAGLFVVSEFRCPGVGAIRGRRRARPSA